MTLFPAFRYRPHKTKPYFAEVFFRFVYTTVFLFPFFILHFFQTLINAYKLYFVLIHYIYIAHENVELVPALSSTFC